MPTGSRETYPRLEDIKTLDDIPDYIFSRPFVSGPPEPIGTPEMLAGFLFPRHGDRTRYRIVRLEKRLAGNIWNTNGKFRTQATLRIYWSTDGMTISSIRKFPVLLEAFEALREQRFLDPAYVRGEDDGSCFELNKAGKHKVVQEWFKDSSGLLDKLGAGGVLGEGGMAYPDRI